MAIQGIQGLFGGVASPEQMQQQLIQQKAAQFAQMTPDQQLGFMGYQGGANLGRGLASAFGVEIQDPAVRQATMLRQLASQFDTRTVEGMQQYAAAIQGISPEAAQQAMEIANKMEEQQASIDLKRAQAEKARTVKDPSTVSERNRKTIADAEVKLAEGKQLTNSELAELRWLIAQETKVKTYPDPVTGEIVRIEPVDLGQAAPNLFKRLMNAPENLNTGASPTQGQQSTGSFAGGKVTTLPTPASLEKERLSSEAKDMAISRLGEGLTNINQAMELMKSPSANPWVSAWAENFPTDARALNNVVTSLKSQKTIDLITQMKQASKTGATGFGSVTEKELDLLQSDIVKLDQRSPTFKEDLKRLQTTWTNLQNKIKSEQAGAKPAAASSTTPNAALEAKIARFMAVNPGMSREAVVAKMQELGHYK